MELWVQHYAWLHSKYPKQKESRLSSILTNNPESPLLIMPDIPFLTYLIEDLIEIGTSMSGGMGVTPLTWSEIKAWSDLTDNRLASWESTIIMRLSQIFVSSYNKFDDKDFETPFSVEEFDREAASKSIGNMLRSLAQRAKK